MTATEPIGGDLIGGDLEITGRITTASNGTYLGTIGSTVVVYKPVSGEAPLWDFPDGTLANREAAAFLVSEAFGWNVVPPTWLREGPFGLGMVQLWREPDAAQDPVDLVAGGVEPEAGWLRVLEGSDENDRPVMLVHEDSVALRRMAVFDLVVNNADRKGAHVLAMPDGHRHGVDHGLTFHVEHKVRTVLWGWVGEPLAPDELEGIERVRSLLSARLGSQLEPLLDEVELAMLADRCERLLARGSFPGPRGGMPAVPWPLF